MSEEEPTTVEKMLDGVQESSTTVNWDKGPKVAKLVEKIIRNKERKDKQ